VVVSTGHADDTVRAEEQAQPRGTPVTTSTVLGLLERQGYRCALTGRQLTPETAALDHIIPIKYGGEHVIENTQVLHKDVNRAKNSMTNVEFAQMCREVAETWRRRAPTPPTLAHVAEDGGRAGNEATSNHNATRGNDAAASGRR
jgi:5-methylcytosine-specific restriction endonuclease McrA